MNLEYFDVPADERLRPWYVGLGDVILDEADRMAADSGTDSGGPGITPARSGHKTTIEVDGCTVSFDPVESHAPDIAEIAQRGRSSGRFSLGLRSTSPSSRDSAI